MKGLLRSRKFWLASVAAAEVAVLDGLGVSADVWGSILAIIMVMIGAIAVEDHGAKAAAKS